MYGLNSVLFRLDCYKLHARRQDLYCVLVTYCFVDVLLFVVGVLVGEKLQKCINATWKNNNNERIVSWGEVQMMICFDALIW